MAEERALLVSDGTTARAPSSRDATHVVEQRCRQKQVGAEPRMELSGLASRASRRRPCAPAARRRSRGGRRARRRGATASRPAPRDRRAPRGRAAPSAGCAISAARNSRNPSSSSASRRIAGASWRRVGVGRLDGTHLHLKPAVEALDPPEDAHGVALGEAPVEQLDVVPDAPLDPPARVDELDREVRLTVARRQLAACGQPHRPRRRCGPRRAPRSSPRAESRGRLARWPTSARFAPSATHDRARRSRRRRTT